MSFLVAGAAPELSGRYKAACAATRGGRDGQGDPLTDLFEVLQKARRYNEYEIMVLEVREHLMLGHPDGQWPFHQDLFALLQSGVLVGFGFIQPRGPNDAPKPMPLDVWHCSTDWEASEVSGNGLSFAGVRVVSNRLIDRVIAEPAESKPSKPVGRPSVRQHVAEAFKAVLAAGSVDVSKPMNRVYDPIRKWLSGSYPEDQEVFSSLSDETIRQQISPEFKRLRQANKQ